MFTLLDWELAKQANSHGKMVNIELVRVYHEILDVQACPSFTIAAKHHAIFSVEGAVRIASLLYWFESENGKLSEYAQERLSWLRGFKEWKDYYDFSRDDPDEEVNNYVDTLGKFLKSQSLI